MQAFEHLIVGLLALRPLLQLMCDMVTTYPLLI